MKQEPVKEPVVSGDRRPLASRKTAWAHAVATWCVRRGITPNAISIGSMVAAVVAATALLAGAQLNGVVAALLLLLAALGCQLRLLCNLIDGMVAVEGGMGSASGPFWNEVPDRFSDVVILIAAGFAADAALMGWSLAVLALMTAYIRELGHRLTGIADFSGWMSKPQRMALVTAACVLAALSQSLSESMDQPIFRLALVVALVGTLWVCIQRSVRLLTSLKHDQDDA